MHELSDNQLSAAMHFQGPALVIAGPGSGKTSVIVKRIDLLIRTHHADPSSILSLTFTRKAAFEMRKRFLLTDTPGGEKVTFSTFHSLFYFLLAEYIPDFRLRPAAECECLSYMKEALRKLGLHEETAPGYLKDISRLKNGLPGPDIDRRIVSVYENILRGKGLIDFDDMTCLFLKLIRNDTDILEKTRKRYRFILLDEFQDINPLQFEVVRLIAFPENHIFAVGDDDQSIYSFRGSDPRIMLSFGKIFEGTDIYFLDHNFRSQGHITRASARLIGHNKNRYKKCLSAVLPDGMKIERKEFANSLDEAYEVLRRVEMLPKTATVGILFRTHRAGSLIKKLLEERKSAVRARVEALSFHAAKGLEFDEVFIVEANRHITPGETSSPEAYEEERRMFYVAVTRARKVLHIFNTKSGYNPKKKRSPFVRELGTG